MKPEKKRISPKERLKNGELRLGAAALKESEDRFRSLFDNMSEGFVYGRIVLDRKGLPRDCVVLETNKAFEKQTGLKPAAVVGRKATEVLPGFEKDPADWIARFGRVALTGRPEQFEDYLEALRRHFSVSAFSPQKGRFAAIFSDITERKEGEKELERLASFPRLNPQPVLEMDLAGNLVYCNPVAAALYPDLKGPAANHPWLGDWKAVARACAAGAPLPAREIEAAGRWYLQTMCFVPESGRVRVYGTDITAAKLAADALREREESLKRAQAMARLGSWELDLVRDELTWSDEAYRIFGVARSSARVTYGDFLERVHPDDRAAVNKAYSSSVKEGRDSYEIEHRVVRAGTGEVRLVHEKCDHVRDASGAIVRSLGMVHDITERKLAEREGALTADFLRLVNEAGTTDGLLKAAADFFRGASGCEAVGIRLRDAAGDYPYYITRGFSREFVRAESSLAPAAAAGCPAAGDGALPLQCLCGAVIGGRFDAESPCFTRHGSFWTASGSRLAAPGAARPPAGQRERCAAEGYESVALIPLHLGDDRLGLVQLNDRRKGVFTPEAMVHWERLADQLAIALAKFRAEETLRAAAEVLKRDKETLRRLAEDRARGLVEAQAELERSKRLSDIGVLAATVAHELRNPLATIGMAARNIKRKAAAGQDLERHIANIDKKISESNQIITNLLFYSRLKPPQCRPLDVRELLEDCLEAAAGRTGAAVVSAGGINALTGVMLEADAVQLKEVLNNLLNNACDALPPGGGRVELGGKLEDHCIRFTVRDNGAGIDPEVLPKVFDPFFSTKAKGTGLGLPVCRQIVHMHRGEIDIRSGPDGTTVTVLLPLEAPMDANDHGR